MTDFALARRNMIDGQLRPNRVTNTQLLAAIGELPRERFLPEARGRSPTPTTMCRLATDAT